MIFNNRSSLFLAKHKKGDFTFFIYQIQKMHNTKRPDLQTSDFKVI